MKTKIMTLLAILFIGITTMTQKVTAADKQDNEWMKSTEIYSPDQNNHEATSSCNIGCEYSKCSITCAAGSASYCMCRGGNGYCYCKKLELPTQVDCSR